MPIERIQPSSLERVAPPLSTPVPAQQMGQHKTWSASLARDQVIVSDAARQRAAASATESGRGLQLDFRKLRELAGVSSAPEQPGSDDSV